jgi:hypothetical protein
MNKIKNKKIPKLNAFGSNTIPNCYSYAQNKFLNYIPIMPIVPPLVDQERTIETTISSLD